MIFLKFRRLLFAYTRELQSILRSVSDPVTTRFVIPQRRLIKVPFPTIFPIPLIPPLILIPCQGAISIVLINPFGALNERIPFSVNVFGICTIVVLSTRLPPI